MSVTGVLHTIFDQGSKLYVFNRTGRNPKGGPILKSHESCASWINSGDGNRLSSPKGTQTLILSYS